MTLTPDQHFKGALQVLEELQQMGDKRTVKVELLAANRSNPILREIFLRTYDWERTYGMRVKYHVVTNSPTQRVKPLFGAAAKDGRSPWEAFCVLLDQLQQRKLTGNAAKEAWLVLVTRLSEQEHQWFSRVLNRDLKIKVTASTIEPIWPDLIRPFGCQLAKSVKDVGEFVPTKKDPWLGWPVVVEPKLDGMRVLIEYKHDLKTCTGYSREGHLLTNIQPMLDTLAEHLASHGKSCWIDSEALVDAKSNDGFNLTMSAVKGENVDPEVRQALRFHCFDLVGSVAGDKRPLSERRKALKAILEGAPEQFVLLRRKTCQNESEMMDYYNGLLDEGYEGVMVKFEAPYMAKRTTAWLKLKPTNTVDARITGYEAGKQGSKNEHRLGAFVVQRLDTKETIKVGGGYTDAQRTEFWSNRDTWVGKILEFKEEARKGASTTANFPRFIRMRPDREK